MTAPPCFLIKVWEIRSAAEKRHAERGLCNDHGFLFSCDLLYQSFTLWLLASPLSIKIYGKQASTLAAMLISLVHLILRSYISFISDVFTQQFLTFNCSLLLSFHILS